VTRKLVPFLLAAICAAMTVTGASATVIWGS
jgi:hypothetical protein